MQVHTAAPEPKTEPQRSLTLEVLVSRDIRPPSSGKLTYHLQFSVTTNDISLKGCHEVSEAMIVDQLSPCRVNLDLLEMFAFDPSKETSLDFAGNRNADSDPFEAVLFLTLSFLPENDRSSKSPPESSRVL